MSFLYTGGKSITFDRIDTDSQTGEVQLWFSDQHGYGVTCVTLKGDDLDKVIGSLLLYVIDPETSHLPTPEDLDDYATMT